MEKDNFNNSEETTKTTSRQSFLKFVLAFLILIIGAVGYLVWSRNYSKNARLYRQNQESLEKYNKFISSFEAAMKADIYGGKTPDETLKMFIDALKKEDIELASKYFALNTNEKSEYYLTRKEWEFYLKEMKERNMLQQMAEDIEKNAKPLTETLDNTKEFSYGLFDYDGTIGVLISLKFNKYSGVWKIESL